MDNPQGLRGLISVIAMSWKESRKGAKNRLIFNVSFIHQRALRFNAEEGLRFFAHLCVGFFMNS